MGIFTRKTLIGNVSPSARDKKFDNQRKDSSNTLEDNALGTLPTMATASEARRDPAESDDDGLGSRDQSPGNRRAQTIAPGGSPLGGARNTHFGSPVSGRNTTGRQTQFGSPVSAARKSIIFLRTLGADFKERKPEKERKKKDEALVREEKLSERAKRKKALNSKGGNRGGFGRSDDEDDEFDIIGHKKSFDGDEVKKIQLEQKN